MNIIVKTYSGKVLFRPDTTWKQGDDSAYLPEFINSVSACPVSFVRICKAGRSVYAKFADRYYDAVGYGVLLYPDDLISEGPEGFACACCMDHTTFLSYPLLDKATLGNRDCKFRITLDGEAYFSSPAEEAEAIAGTIERTSRFCYLRTGDFLVTELSERRHLAARRDSEKSVCGFLGDNMIFDFKVVF